jgi:hypothetical protein
MPAPWMNFEQLITPKHKTSSPQNYNSKQKSNISMHLPSIFHTPNNITGQEKTHVKIALYL